jgi:hypothetical protein
MTSADARYKAARAENAFLLVLATARQGCRDLRVPSDLEERCLESES